MKCRPCPSEDYLVWTGYFSVPFLCPGFQCQESRVVGGILVGLKYPGLRSRQRNVDLRNRGPELRRDKEWQILYNPFRDLGPRSKDDSVCRPSVWV